MVKISIITPVYNVQNYLSKCLESILNQTLRDYELIIVDDGSPDKSGIIADEYKKIDSRIKVVHKENGGAPSARNIGIDMAEGKYLYFPDSDDWLEPNYLENLYKCAIKSNADLTISGFVIEYFENNESHSFQTSVNSVNFNNYKSVRENIHNYFNNMMVAVPWNKLYKTNYIKENNIRFPNLKWDDLHFNLEVLKNINSVSISSISGYHFFRSRAGSETTTVFDGLLYEKRREQFTHILDIYGYWGISDPNIMNVLYGYYAARLVQCIQEISINNLPYKRKTIKNILNDDISNIAVKNGLFDSKILELANFPLKYHLYTTCLITGKILGFVKIHMTSFFYKFKAQSVNKAIKVK
ncbi:glycosyltransferase family 2 protein [Companilactobacillus nodensis]|uniref:Group 2 glycosyl transferase n=1 Tax=Companilactobacillus nodensis DSM 19682 = JCM 14932 = NBRC 107160 TaxID=1423775 RepID=A0A0R1K6F1_9LACO|nr:glycosyltransferase family 2 protein [Companilactobacillus nodensis]KRK79024.1 group 2 glycosyl transferase [Companilactobacillus nodensis DSM 19682 = JCM 14932 = NBRC 107160]